jgi:hypothetical protein
MVVGVDDAYACTELDSEGECQTLTYNLMPWLILSYISLQIDDELLPWLLGALARCDVVLLPFRAYAKCVINKLQGFEEFVCHEHGLVEPVAISLEPERRRTAGQRSGQTRIGPHVGASDGCLSGDH